MEHHEAQQQKGVALPQQGFLRGAPPSLLPGVLNRLSQTERYIAAQRSRQDLLNALEHPQWEIRAAAVYALGKLGPRAPLEPLLDALQDEHRLVRAAAIRASGALVEHTPEQQVLVEHVLLAMRDEAWEVREIAALVLGELSTYPSEPLLRTALRDSNSCVREAACFALERREAARVQTNDEAQGRSVVLPPSIQAEVHVKASLFHLWLVFSRQFSLLNRNIWLITVLAMVIACILTFVLGVDAGWSLTVAVLSASAIGAAHIYGSGSDASIEIVLSTSTSIRTILLARLAAVLSYNIALAALTSTLMVLVYGGGLWTLIHLWLGPALFVSSLSLALSLLLGSLSATVATLLFEASQVFHSEGPFFVLQPVDLATSVWQLHPVYLFVIALGCIVFAVLYAPRHPRLARS